MLSTTRDELALAAGVSKSTIVRWLKKIMPQLHNMGLKKGEKIFTPAQTELICRHLDIELNKN